MKSRTLMCITAMTLFAALSLPLQLAAQHRHYKLIDFGTFGGPTNSTQDELQVLNRRGMVAGSADTSIPQHPNACIFCGDPFISHAFQWRNGVLIELPTLPGLNNSGANWISDSGLVAGFSESVAVDPLFGVREAHAVLWKNGQISDLGTLEGGHESIAFAVNSRGQVAGAALNALGHQRPFLWENGVMHDLGTLGGPDAGVVGSFKGNVEMNERSQVVACSDTNSTINPVTGSPTIDPFLWENGAMIDLGTLGGTSGCAIYLNNRGQVVGYSNVAGDVGCPDMCEFHPFLWERGVIKDLGTLGGTYGFANWISDAGEIAGSARTQGDQALHAFLWKNGIMTDLGTLPGDPCSFSQAINSKGQMVGESQGVCFPQASRTRAFLWENGGPMLDLNTLIPSGSGLQLVGAVDINDRGEIVGSGVLPNGDFHAILLIPCDENHPNIEGCDYSMVEESATARVSTMPTPRLSPDAMRQFMKSFGLRSRLWYRGLGASPRD
jgi:probable HAF family extracellular repeat protein